jgi:uncharacterized membrane protein YhiD involved in acid resistance
MLETLFGASAETAISVTDAILTIVVSFILGGIISLTYMKTSRRANTSQNFALTLVMLPIVVAIIILLIGSNVARAFSLAGAFSIIRFRSAPGDPKDISYVLFTMAAGLSAGTGYFLYAILFTIVLCLIMAFLSYIKFGGGKKTQKLLKITIPENLNYEGAIDEVIKDYTSSYELKKIKTTDMGSLFELVYNVTLDDKKSQKDFLDALRCRNGNLNITLSMIPDASEY